MPNIRKLLSKFSKEERLVLESLINTILSLNWCNLDIKKLKGYPNIFRVRKGKLRIIFSKDKTSINILLVERRNDNTYKI